MLKHFREEVTACAIWSF